MISHTQRSWLTRLSRPQDYDKALNEVKIIRKCSHVNIVRYKDCFISQTNTGVTVLSIVMEYADAGDLQVSRLLGIRKPKPISRPVLIFQEFIKRQMKTNEYLDEKTIRYFFVQIGFALSYLHKNQILHRDLKSQNIFMTSTKLLKLGDFGISKTLRWTIFFFQNVGNV